MGKVTTETTRVKTVAPLERRQVGDTGTIELMDHTETVEWLAKHPEILSGFENEWVAVVGREVVGHGPSIIDAFEAAKTRGFDDPLMVPVWLPDTVFFE